MTVTEEKNTFTYISDGCFSLERTLDCGQCFRFEKTAENVFEGVAQGRVIKISQEGNALTFYDTDEKEFNEGWFPYFDFGRDYAACDRLLCTDSRLKTASEYARGIHIMNQEPWETLLSFIISQNNNIPRIKGIISRLCELCGKPLKNGFYAFPTAGAVSKLKSEELAPLRAGFRVRYIMDAAKKTASGEIQLETIKNMPIDDARAELMKITGVGKKVADCTLLYGMGKIEAFPEDVWIKRAMAELFADGLPERFVPVGGIAQQYLFHYMRTRGDGTQK